MLSNLMHWSLPPPPPPPTPGSEGPHSCSQNRRQQNFTQQSPARIDTGDRGAFKWREHAYTYPKKHFEGWGGGGGIFVKGLVTRYCIHLLDSTIMLVIPSYNNNVCNSHSDKLNIITRNRWMNEFVTRQSAKICALNLITLRKWGY